MKRQLFQLLALCAVWQGASAAGHKSNSESFRIVTYMNQVGQPGAIMEGSSGVL